MCLGKNSSHPASVRAFPASECAQQGAIPLLPQALQGLWENKKLPRLPGGALRVCRAGSVVTCTYEQVGRLSSVSLLPTSGRSREACNPQIQIGIPYKRCGFHEPQVHQDNTHTAEDLLLLAFYAPRPMFRTAGSGRGKYYLSSSSSSSSSKSRTMKCSYTSWSCSSSSMDSKSSSPFSSSTDRRITMP